MTIEYKDSKRITAVSSDTKPTNVQDNSILVEKDNARRYWFDAEIENTKTVDENFDSTGLLTWTESHSANISVDSSTNERLDFDFKRDNSNDTAYHQLSSALSDSSWVMDFDLTLTTVTQAGGSDVVLGYIGMASSIESDNSDSHDGMYLEIGVNNSSVQKFRTLSQNNQTLVSVAVDGGVAFTSVTPSATTYYVRMIRDGNDLTVKLFSSSARTGTATEEKTHTKSGITGLDLITIKNLDFSGTVGSTLTGYIDNLKIYDGVTSATIPATWNMQPTLEYDLSTSAGWTTTGSNCSVNTSGQYLEGSSSTNDDRATKALGITLSDTKFVVRQKMELTDVTTGGNGQLYFGYTDKDNSTTVLGNRDAIGITIRTGADFLQSYALNQAWQSSATLTTTPTETTYYLEIIRDSATSHTLNLYSDSNYSVLIETKTNTISSSINGLDHITIGGWDNNASGNITARFSNIEIYNGVSSIN